MPASMLRATAGSRGMVAGDGGDAENVGHVTLGQGPGFGDDDHAVVGDAAADRVVRST